MGERRGREKERHGRGGRVKDRGDEEQRGDQGRKERGRQRARKKRNKKKQRMINRNK